MVAVESVQEMDYNDNCSSGSMLIYEIFIICRMVNFRRKVEKHGTRKRMA